MLNKLINIAFSVSVFLFFGFPAHAVDIFSYEKNMFINYWSCIGIYSGSTLGLGESVWIFSKNISPVLGKVVHIIPSAEAKMKFDALGFDKVYKDKPLWEKIRCAHSYRGDMPESLAQVSPEPKEADAIGLVIRGLPAGAWISRGKGEATAMGIKDNPYVSIVRDFVTDACYAPDSLVRVKRFPVHKGRAIVQLDIGKAKKLSPEKRKQKIADEMQQAERMYAKWAWPEYKKKLLEELDRKNLFESVEICRFYLDEKRVLKSVKISRNIDVEERVDTGIELDNESWAETTDSAVGFISLNEGKDWDALFLDVGFEGINYSIEQLNDSVVRYERSLYTYH